MYRPQTTAENRAAISTTKEMRMATKKTGKRSNGGRKSARKYSPAAGKQVETEMREMKQGKLKSGRSGKKVTSRKQAIAIGLSKAREAGEKVPEKRA
jgi:hypothetical protein